MNREYQWFSALLCYPEADLLAALPEFQAALSTLPAAAATSGAAAFLDYLRSHSLIDLQQNYVATFDRNRSHALYIFEHVYGEDRGRGMAMVDLLEEYRQEGFELADNELPDYLPAIGRSDRFDNLFYAFGHQHLGLTLAAVSGELVAGLCTDAPGSIDLAPFDLRRFG